MKKILYIYILLFVGIASSYAIDGGRSSKEKMQEANELYRSGNYEEAKNHYESIIKANRESASLYYNLGNSYFKLGNYSKSILNYERALLINPGNSDVKYNLKIAQKSIVDKIAPIPEFFLKTWYNGISAIFSVNNWAYISISLFILFIVAIGFYIYSNNLPIKKISFVIGIISIILSLTSINFANHRNNILNDRNFAIILSPSITVKGSPDSSGTSLFVVHEGLKIKVIGGLGDWVNIKLSDGNEGWIEKQDLEVI